MKIETMKSVILVILIGFSLLLSVALWNYQPELESVDQDSTIENIRLEDVGEERTARQLIQPSKFIFHKDGTHYSYEEHSDQFQAYSSLKDWQLVSTIEQVDETDHLPGAEKIELIFPTLLPVEVLGNIFTVDNIDLGNQVFDRIHMKKADDSSVYEIWVTRAGQERSVAAFQASLSENMGVDLLEAVNDQQLIEYLHVNDLTDEPSRANADIYVPSDTSNIEGRVLQTNPVPVTPLQNYLFPAASNVTSDFLAPGETRLSDSDRTFTVVDDERWMEYESRIPNQVNSTFLPEYELFLESQADLNDHLGFTNTFQLDSVQRGGDVQYRMYFSDLPVLEYRTNHPYHMIRLEYVGDTVQRYSRPLIQFTTANVVSATLPSGQQAAEYLVQSDRYDLENVTAMKIGYELVGQETNIAYDLLPYWYVNESGIWKKLFADQLSEMGQL
ncbi:hypothetical protein EQV77_13675 [Halobacillus fulvus]|nr:hypothetical protein EQV77_13675 [Halobacillus fulvus]